MAKSEKYWERMSKNIQDPSQTYNKRPDISSKDAEFTKLLYEIQHNTNGKVICLSINLPNERIEKKIPGTYKNYQKFNGIIESVCKEKDAIFLNLDDLKAEEHFPDGIHFSEEGNKAVADRLLKHIEERGIF